MSGSRQSGVGSLDSRSPAGLGLSLAGFEARLPRQVGKQAARGAVAVVCGWLLLHLAACASMSGSAKFNHSMPRPGRAALYVGRPDGRNVSHVPLRMELDGRPLAQLGVDTYTRIELLPGTYKLAAADNYLTSVTHGRLRPLTLKVEAGRSYFVLPMRPVENVRPSARMAGNAVAPAETASGGFTAQKDRPPAAFAGLSYVIPDAAGD